MPKSKVLYNANSLYQLCFDFVAKNIHSYGSDDRLKYLTAQMKDNLLRTLTDSFWKQPMCNFIFGSLIHSKTLKVDLSKAQLDDDLLRSLRICKKLKDINLIKEGPHNISKEELINFLENQSEAETLHIQDCTVVDDSVVECIALNCPKLRCLNLKSCINFTDNGLCSLKSLELHKLKLSRTMITTAGLIEYIKGPSGKLLKELVLDNCINVSSEGLQEIVKYCPTMEIFVFHFCMCPEEAVELFGQPEYAKNFKQLSWSITW